jgi:predicted dehydrogenase
MSLKAGVIGLRMGSSHVAGYVQNPHTDVAVVCDIDEAHASKVAQQHGVPKVVTDYRELLAEDLDIVSVSTPDQLHAEHCIAALEGGKHVLCEKPMAQTVEECEAMVAAADASGKQFMVGQVCRFAPGFALTKKLVDDGTIGKLFLVESEYAHDYTHVKGVGGWRVDPVRLREPFVGGACHAVDLLRWIAGNVAECHAFANRFVLTDWPVDDCTVANFRFESGVIGQVMCSIGCKRPYTMRSCFHGDEGTIISDNTSPTIQVYSTKYPTTLQFSTMPVNLASHNVASEIAQLVDAILNDKPVPTDVREGARTVATCRAAVESAASGQPVTVQNEF